MSPEKTNTLYLLLASGCKSQWQVGTVIQTAGGSMDLLHKNLDLGYVHTTFHVQEMNGSQAGHVQWNLRDHCHERPPALKDHQFLAGSPTFQCKWTCHQRPPVLRDHIFMTNGVVFQDKFYCSRDATMNQILSLLWKVETTSWLDMLCHTILLWEL